MISDRFFLKFWKETSILITQGLNPFYAVRIFDSYVKRVTYCMTIWFGSRTVGKTFPRRFGKLFMPKRTVLSSFCFWFSTNWLGLVCSMPVCKILELEKNDKTINVGMMQSIKRASDMSPFPLVPRGPLRPLIFPSC